MALPSTGPISMAMVRTELSRSGQIRFGDSDVRTLAGRPSGSIAKSHLRGKSHFTGVRVTPGSPTPEQPLGDGGYIKGSYGSIAPNTYKGYEIQGIYTTFTIETIGYQVNWYINVEITGNHAKNFFTELQLGSSIIPSANFTGHTYSGGITKWRVLGGSGWGPGWFDNPNAVFALR